MRNDIILTPRELQIVKLICQEKPVKQICSELFLTEKTVLRNAANIRKKIGCQTVVGIVKYAYISGIWKP